MLNAGSCCKNKIVKPSTSEQKIVDAVNNSSTVKSSRFRPGSAVKQCINCGNKTILNSCPLCAGKTI